MPRQLIARGADLVGMRRGQNRRRYFLGALVLERVEPHVGPRPQNVGIDLVGEVFDVEHALVVDGHRATFSSGNHGAWQGWSRGAAEVAGGRAGGNSAG